MSRRAIGLLVTLVLGILMAPAVAVAQPAANVPRIGFFSSDPPASDTGLTVAHIVEGGHPDSVHEPSRREMAQAMYRMFGTLAHPERTLHVAVYPAHDMAIGPRSGFL